MCTLRGGSCTCDEPSAGAPQVQPRVLSNTVATVTYATTAYQLARVNPIQFLQLLHAFQDPFSNHYLLFLFKCGVFCWLDWNFLQCVEFDIFFHLYMHMQVQTCLCQLEVFTVT